MAPQTSPSVTKGQQSPTLVSVDGRFYPLRSAHIRGRAEGGLAQSTLIQEFANPYAEPLEVVYTMPLPADGAVLGYTIRIGERVIRGEIESRDKAEATYKKALYEGRTAGLLEQDRADTFRQRLGNVPPLEDVRVEIDALHPLAFLAGVDAAGPLWEFRFPTVVGVRYEGAPGRVPDAGRLDLDRGAVGGIPTRFGIDLDLAVEGDGVLGSTITSPSHEILLETRTGGARVTLAEGARLDRDLVVRWAAAVDEVGMRMVEGRGLTGDTGRYAIVTLTPPRVPAVAFHRDLTVLLDASGSMAGEPLVAAKEIVAGLLESLEKGDRFEVLAFATDTRSLTHGVEDSSAKAVERAVRAVRAISANGGTEMATAFKEALAPLRRDSQRQVVLVTDGQIGFEDEVMEKLGRSLPSGVRVHVVGVGSAANRTLTAGVARAGRGVELMASDVAAAEETWGRLRVATVRPVLTEIHVGGSAVVGSAPEYPRDVMCGQPLVVAMELRSEGGTIEVTASLAGAEEVWRRSVEVPAVGATTTPLPIGAYYGREAIADVEAHLFRGRSAERSNATIEALGMRHRITSRFTSLVAVAEEPSVDPLAPRRRERLPVELPAGVSAAGVGLVGHMRMRMIYKATEPMLSELPETDLTLEMSKSLFGAKHIATPRSTVLLVSEVIGFKGPELTVEIEVPEDGFWLPEGEVKVSFGAQSPRLARIIEERSSPKGPHALGTRVRITFHLQDAEGWADEVATVEWPRAARGHAVIYRIEIDPKGATHLPADA